MENMSNLKDVIKTPQEYFDNPSAEFKIISPSDDDLNEIKI
jgi:hypothetical protein